VYDLLVAEDYQDLSKRAAEIVAAQLRAKPDSVIGFATGRTPLGLYRQLIEMYRRQEVSFARITTFNLDEYVGLDRQHPRSYYRFMWENLFSQIDVDPNRIHFPAGVFQDEREACEAYERELAAAGGLDLQILGIGANGHIGFNEPAETFTLSTHIVELTEETRRANARFFADISEVPKRAITMGIGNIMSALAILLLASELTRRSIATMKPPTGTWVWLRKDANSTYRHDEGGRKMIRFDVKVTTEGGLHARPASLLTNTANQVASSIRLYKDGKQAEAKSILSLMLLGAKAGDVLTVEVEGADEEEAAENIRQLFESGFSL
jgi:glucosamine-6-phosphate deaminase